MATRLHRPPARPGCTLHAALLVPLPGVSSASSFPAHSPTPRRRPHPLGTCLYHPPPPPPPPSCARARTHTHTLSASLESRNTVPSARLSAGGKAALRSLYSQPHSILPAVRPGPQPRRLQHLLPSCRRDPGAGATPEATPGRVSPNAHQGCPVRTTAVAAPHSPARTSRRCASMLRVGRGARGLAAAHFALGQEDAKWPMAPHL